MKRNILMNPGPITTTETVKQALVIPDLCHRESEFAEMVKEIRQGICDILDADSSYSCVLQAGSGSAAVEGAIASCMPEGKTLAVVNQGLYGQRMLDMAKTYKIPTLEIKAPPLEKVDPKLVEWFLSSSHNIGALAVVHHESSTGVLNDLDELAALCQKVGCLFIVDGISSIGGVPLSLKKTPIDLLVGSSNKCLQGFSGVCFVVGKRAVLEDKDPAPRSFYLDLKAQHQALEKDDIFRFTAPVQLVSSLRQAVREFKAEGLEKRCARYAENHQILLEGLKELGIKFAVAPEHRSVLLVLVEEPVSWPGYSFKKLHDFLYERNFTIFPVKQANQNVFRISSFGDITPQDVRNFLGALKEFVTGVAPSTRATS